MTVHNYYTVELTDIVTIRLKCRSKECGIEILYNPSDGHVPPDACPKCRIEWTTHDGPDRKALVEFFRALHGLRQGLLQKVSLSLELPALTLRP